jgi:uncharacterized membrane protein
MKKMKFNPFLFFEKANRLRAVLIGFIILCCVLFVIEFFVKRYVYFEIEGVYNFYSFFGFIMFSIIIFGSRLLRFLLGRPENFYDKKAVDSEDYPETWGK